MLRVYVSETVRIPGPVYSKATTEAERQDVSRGVIIKQWREKAEKYDEMGARHR